MVKKVLMVCYGGGHVRIINNIYRILKQEKNIKIVILALTKAQEFLEEKKVEYMTLKKYNKIIGDANYINLGKKIIRKLGENYVDEESILYYFHGTIDLIKEFGENKVIEGYKKFGRRVFLPLSFIEKVIEYEKPDLVLTTNSPRTEKAALIVANKKGIPTISIEDLLGVFNKENKKIEKFFNSELYKESFGNTICVLSEIAKKNIEKRTKGNVFISGNPNFDTIFEHNQSNYFSDTSKTLCYLSQSTEDNLKIFKILLESLETKIIDRLIIKLHPNEKKEKYYKLNSKYNNIAEFEENLYLAILKSDIVLTEYSTAGIEAILLGKHVISKKNNIVNFELLGERLVFRDIFEITEKIKYFFKNRIYIKKNNEFKTIKNASECIVELIVKTLNF